MIIIIFDFESHYNSDDSFDIVLQTIDLSNLPPDVGIFLQYLVPCGVLLLIAGTQSTATMV